MGLWFDHHVTAKAAVFAEGATGRVHKGHTLIHPVITQPLLQNTLTLRQLPAVVDSIYLIGVAHLHLHRHI